MLPLKGYSIKGIVWYQGESNAHNMELHERLFPMLQKSWRNFFHDPDLPFYFRTALQPESSFMATFP